MDVVVTVPKRLWREWLGEGDLAYADDSGHAPGWAGDYEYGFVIAGRGRGAPLIKPEERVYIVAHGMLRGYAPLKYIGAGERFGGKPGSLALIRRGHAIAVTLDDPIRGFQGVRYRWWDRDLERPFPRWKVAGVS